VSNLLAPAMVTETLRQRLSVAAARAVPGAQVTLGRPRAAPGDSEPPSINLFPYLVQPNAALRNADLPLRSSEGALGRRPRIAIDVHYMLSFIGPESELVPERLMGSSMSMLHAQPVLTGELIEQALGTLLDADPDHFLGDADLTNQIDRIKISPLPLNLEELSRLWSVFFQVPYVLSIAYEASVLLIEEPVAPRAPALPVRERGIFIRPLPQIRIDSVSSTDGPDSPIHADSGIRILGSDLGGERVSVLIGSEELTPTQVLEDEIQVDLTSLSAARAGIRPLRVVRRVSDETPQLRFESNSLPLILAPRIESITFSPAAGADPASVELEVFPAVAEDQGAQLLLNELPEADAESPPLSYVLEVAPVGEATSTLTMPLVDVETRAYLLRVRIEGGTSPLVVDEDADSDTFGHYIGPRLEVT